MAAMTEAACLLKSGAAFARRAALVGADGRMVFAGTKPGAFALYFDDEPFYHIDLDGRWQRAYIAGTHYLKSLDGVVHALDRVREAGQMVLHRRRLPFAEAADLDASVRSMAIELTASLDTAQLTWQPPPEGVPLDIPSLRSLLDLVCDHDAAACFRDQEAFRAAYGPGPLPFFPPSCPQPVLLRATVPSDLAGCWALGPQAATVRSTSEFAEHARDVAKALGRRVAQARGLVLTGGDALRQPAAPVLSWLETATFLFPLAETSRRPSITERSEHDALLDGIYAFLDSPVTPHTAQDWTALASAGLRHVDIGVVSGAEPVRRVHGADWAGADLHQLVSMLHDAGIGVGLVVVYGCGGTEDAEAHLAGTLDLLLHLPLRAGDILYLVDLDELAGDEGADGFLRSCGRTPLDASAREKQLQELREGLKPLRAERKVKVVPYTLEKQA